MLYGYTRKRLILFCAYLVLKDLKCFCDVPRHGEVHLSTFIIPIEGNTDVSLAVPFCSNAVIVFQRRLEMEGMLFAEILPPEIVDNKGELDWSPFVLPKAWHELALVVTAFVESLLKQFVGQQAGLRKAIHAPIFFDVNHVVVRHD